MRLSAVVAESNTARSLALHTAPLAYHKAVRTSAKAPPSSTLGGVNTFKFWKQQRSQVSLALERHTTSLMLYQP